MISAMKAKESVKVTTLRGLMSAFTNELVALKQKPDGELPDEAALKVVSREAKKRNDSIEQYATGGRPELAEDEKAELEIIKVYLPQMMSKEDIKKIAEGKKAEMNVTDKAKLGILVGAVMKEAKGKADGNDVKQVVESLF